MYASLKDSLHKPYGTLVYCLVSFFSHKDGVRFIYILHNIYSDVVTYKKNESNNYSDNTTGEDENCIHAYKDNVEKQMKILKVGDEEKLRIAYVYCQNEELRAAQMFSEFLGCDTTAGVTREQRKLFLFDDVDETNKLFIVFYCCMHSKEARVYHQALWVSMKKLVTEITLSHNQLISTNEEISMYHPLISTIENAPCMYISKHRLGKYHILQKEQMINISLKVTWEPSKTIIDDRLGVLNDMFDCIEI